MEPAVIECELRVCMQGQAMQPQGNFSIDGKLFAPSGRLLNEPLVGTRSFGLAFWVGKYHWIRLEIPFLNSTLEE